MSDNSEIVNLLCIGFGYTAQEVARQNPNWQITGTSRSLEKPEDWLSTVRHISLNIDEDRFLDPTSISETTHILISVPPKEDGDKIALQMGEEIEKLPNLKWVGYLSTTGVYGNLDGDTADEETPRNPSGARGARRVKAEDDWLKLDLPVHVFRLPGIYGPGRNQIVSLQKGKAHRIVKKGHVFSRIHVADIAAALKASMLKPNPGSAYNVTDDMSAPPQDVVTYAAELLGVEPPPLQDFETAELSPMARSFYSDNKRVSNGKMKRELGVTLTFPTYKIGLKALSEAL